MRSVGRRGTVTAGWVFGGLVLWQALTTVGVAAAATLGLSPSHGKAGQPFVASYSPSACLTRYVSFSWDGSAPGGGKVLATKTCSLATTGVSASLVPPSGPAGGHSVFAYLSDAAGTPNTVANSAQATYIVDAAAPPTVITLAASDVSDRAATLHATVNPHGCTAPGGAQGTWSFQLGPTTQYELKGPQGVFDLTKTTDVPIGGGVSGLNPSTTYHVRATAFACGAGQGADLTFTTAGGGVPVLIVVGGVLAGLGALVFGASKAGLLGMLKG